MEIEVRDKFVQDLRDFADFIEEKGEYLPMDSYDCDFKVTCSLYDETTYDWETGETTVVKTAKELMREAAKALGKADKVWSEKYLDLQKDFGGIQLEFTIRRDQVCERKVVGTKVIPEKVIPERVEPEKVEEIVEWVCDDPLLAS